VSARELVFVYLRRAHGGPWAPGEDSLFGPLSPGSPAVDPSRPFRLVALRRTAAYATYGFLAPAASRVTIDSLRRGFGDRSAAIVVQG
jgi:hypothetical protein